MHQPAFAGYVGRGGMARMGAAKERAGPEPGQQIESLAYKLALLIRGAKEWAGKGGVVSRDDLAKLEARAWCLHAEILDAGVLGLQAIQMLIDLGPRGPNLVAPLLRARADAKKRKLNRGAPKTGRR